MGIHNEINFELPICEHLAANGWLYAVGDAAHYDRTNGVYLPDVLAWLEVSQPDAFAKLSADHGAGLPKLLAERLRKSLDERGTLDVLRRGIEIVGLKRPLDLVQFKPAHGLTPALMALYAANRLRVVRQVHHSVNDATESIDLVLFVNGIAVSTVELKSDYTQSVGDAIDQYRFDRHPHPKGGKREPLLAFPGGALVHFAVAQSEVRMCTKLAGTGSSFLPFNRGNNGGAGNAPNPNGIATSYLWEEVWQRDSWLQILSRYVIGQRDDKKQLKAYIFPRYHQLDATRKLVAEVLEQGAGGRYLIQHSAGSGKTNSIAWSAHFLADLHKDNAKLFDSVIVVSDRNVLDAQLQEAIFDFERTTGVVAAMTRDQGSKSAQLKTALASGKKIIVCTIQTFPAAMKAAQELAATEGKRFAVIADEAHSSQTGEAASKLKQLLSAQELEDLKDGGEIDTETLLELEMQGRAGAGKGLTYVAFTATPKGKTLELFGRKDEDGLPRPFHVYSMRQAIEEGFILDVLKNYTPYKLAFRLATEGGKEISEREVERSEATKRLMQWVRLHDFNIASKVQIVVEHFRQNVQPLLDGKAKAMVVVASRKEAVRWQKAMRAYIASQRYPLGVLTAFSGEVEDPESYPEAVTEASKLLNPDLKGRDIREAFATEEFHLLLVANKFQTGFDQPLLCGMYVDKILGGIQAVQTLSRLNRAYPGKDTTYILDFVNDPADILAAFKTYYETAELEATTDPNLIYDLRTKLDAQGYYDQFEVDAVLEAEFSGKMAKLDAAIAPVADRLLRKYKAAQLTRAEALASGKDEAAKAAKDTLDALVQFKGDMGAYVRLYSFLAQLFDYGNTDIERRHHFYKFLIPLLEFGREREQVDLSSVVLTHHSLRSSGKQNLSLTPGDAPKLPPIDASGSGAPQDKQRLLLEEIIRKVNGLFDGQLTDNDQLGFVNSIKGKMLDNVKLAEQAGSNAKAQFSNSPDLGNALTEAVMDAMETHANLSAQALNSEAIRVGLLEVLLGPGQLWEALRQRAETQARR